MNKDLGKAGAAMGPARRTGKPVNVIVEVKKRRRALATLKPTRAEPAPPRPARDGDKHDA